MDKINKFKQSLINNNITDNNIINNIIIDNLDLLIDDDIYEKIIQYKKQLININITDINLQNNLIIGIIQTFILNKNNKIINEFDNYDFKFVNNDNYDILIRNFANNCGEIIEKNEINDFSSTKDTKLRSFYKIKVKDENVINKFKSLYKQFNYRSDKGKKYKKLSKKDIIFVYNNN